MQKTVIILKGKKPVLKMEFISNSFTPSTLLTKRQVTRIFHQQYQT